MKLHPTELPEVIVVEPEVFRDARGFFLETFHERRFRDAGLDVRFVQDNHSRSYRNVVRGLHAQVRRPQGKLVRVTAGEIFDVALDIRRGSATFGRWVAVRLTADEPRACWVPPGFAHGFCVTSEEAAVEYKCTDFYDPADELTVRWDDPDLAIPWPVEAPRLSARDRAAPRLRDLVDRLPEPGE